MKKTFKILFFVKRTRVAKNGEVPVQVKVTVNRERAEVSINLTVKPESWNAATEKAIGKDRKSVELNSRLDTVRFRLMEIYREMELNAEYITVRKIVDKYLGVETKPPIMLLEIFRDHNKKCQKLMGKDMSVSTVKRYETSYRHTEEFIKLNYQKEDIPIEDVNYQFVKDYEFFLKTERNCCHNSTMKYLKNFKKIIRIAIANEWLHKDPFMNFKVTFEEVKREFLEQHELEKIMSKEFKIERLSSVRDILVFCCYTGLAFSDVKTLSQEHLVTDNEDEFWIRKPRVKTNNMCNIPLLDIPKQILDKYRNHPICQKSGVLLPVLSNQKMNAYLHEIAEVCGIKKDITTHTARHNNYSFLLKMSDLQFSFPSTGNDLETSKLLFLSFFYIKNPKSDFFSKNIILSSIIPHR
ncbi:site-specific integrase [Dysgonomonas sp. Marseille-P4677]|uniref:site-specific integrase n=1 Tax=Dysgonomonas sp. Marseille-P4677 TaxID=2364790 RepID=UPI0019114CFF|nr:site-specific integrase [Dysgonomonas sp. Marseille-P4677]MBK5721712.1 site-specific integrase [Dysgonomonas sp. Marseille-P4677]